MGLFSDMMDEACAKDEKLAEIRAAILRYYTALDRREHGGAAAQDALHSIEATMGMRWVQGASNASVDEGTRIDRSGLIRPDGSRF